MDLITQAALGAGMGECIMGKRLGKRALTWGALFGVMPEFIESLFFPLLDTARELACSRALGHSLVVMVLGSWGLAYGLERLWVTPHPKLENSPDRLEKSLIRANPAAPLQESCAASPPEDWPTPDLLNTALAV